MYIFAIASLVGILKVLAAKVTDFAMTGIGIP